MLQARKINSKSVALNEWKKLGQNVQQDDIQNETHLKRLMNIYKFGKKKETLFYVYFQFGNLPDRRKNFITWIKIEIILIRIFFPRERVSMIFILKISSFIQLKSSLSLICINIFFLRVAKSIQLKQREKLIEITKCL